MPANVDIGKTKTYVRQRRDVVPSSESARVRFRALDPLARESSSSTAQRPPSDDSPQTDAAEC